LSKTVLSKKLMKISDLCSVVKRYSNGDFNDLNRKQEEYFANMKH